MISVNRFPIVIYTNYRTGSTPLAYALQEEYHLRIHIEPSGFSYIKDYKTSLFLEQFKTRKDYVVKFMPDQMADLPELDVLLKSDCYKIHLYREDLVAQIASYYIAKKRNKWHYRLNEDKKEYIVEITPYELKEAADKIILNNELAAQCTAKFDIAVSYESLGFIENAHYVFSKLPKNVKEIHEEVRKLL